MGAPVRPRLAPENRLPERLRPALKGAAGQLGNSLISGLHYTGIDTKCHCRIGVTETMGDGTCVIAGGCRHGR
jgi:hypothetical protein